MKREYCIAKCISIGYKIYSQILKKQMLPFFDSSYLCIAVEKLKDTVQAELMKIMKIGANKKKGVWATA